MSNSNYISLISSRQHHALCKTFQVQGTRNQLAIFQTNINFYLLKYRWPSNDPRKTATCRTCRKEIEIVVGGHVNSSFTFGLTFHLKDHPSEWTDFLNELAKMIVPDVKSKYELYTQMSSQTLAVGS